jgi:hypothetical protein
MSRRLGAQRRLLAPPEGGTPNGRLSGSGPTLSFSGPPDCDRGQEAGEAPRLAEGTTDM